ncbi:hypothetical protein ACH5RR_032516 [Cinchona calisaya]|uniref:Uncharacterized protein n=1 Tax=Cinchona calisaya TaxID=153742 RepID=A0ABD2YI97_9GENT
MSSMGDNTNTTADSPCLNLSSSSNPSGPSQSSSKVDKGKAAIPSLPPKDSKVTTTTVGETVDSKYVEELTPNVTTVRNWEGEIIESVTDKRDSRIRGLPSEFDWDYARNLLPFLKVFYDTTVRLSGSLYVTGNQYMVEIYAVGFFLTRLMECSDENLAAMASRMKKEA